MIAYGKYLSTAQHPTPLFKSDKPSNNQFGQGDLSLWILVLRSWQLGNKMFVAFHHVDGIFQKKIYTYFPCLYTCWFIGILIMTCYNSF